LSCEEREGKGVRECFGKNWTRLCGGGLLPFSFICVGLVIRQGETGTRKKKGKKRKRVGGGVWSNLER